VLSELEVRPVLTAHPTEATRRTLLSLAARLSELLLRRESASPTVRMRIEDSIEADIELLWLTDEVRRDRLNVLDEVSSAIYYLEDRLLDAAASVDAAAERGFREVFGRELGVTPRLTLGSWVGGDRDGPFVTPEIAIAAMRRTSHALLAFYHRRIDDLVARISISDRLTPAPEELRASLDKDKLLLPEIWEANRRRDAHEPLRLKLTFMAGRIEALRKEIASRDAGRPERVLGAYASDGELAEDLELVRRALIQSSAEHARTTLVEPLVTQLKNLGFFGYHLDLREDAEAHTKTLDAVAEAAGLAPLDARALRTELSGKRRCSRRMRHFPKRRRRRSRCSR
jgi:phosphoenolpyruvate carboxylase